MSVSAIALLFQCRARMIRHAFTRSRTQQARTRKLATSTSTSNETLPHPRRLHLTAPCAGRKPQLIAALLRFPSEHTQTLTARKQHPDNEKEATSSGQHGADQELLHIDGEWLPIQILSMRFSLPTVHFLRRQSDNLPRDAPVFSLGAGLPDVETGGLSTCNFLASHSLWRHRHSWGQAHTTTPSRKPSIFAPPGAVHSAVLVSSHRPGPSEAQTAVISILARSRQPNQRAPGQWNFTAGSQPTQVR